MNREIKFRAWNKEINTMGSALPLDVLLDDVATDIGREKYLRDRNNIVIMQFTGLKDKNGVEIYEGDVVTFPDTESEYVDTGGDEVGSIMTKVAETEINSFAPVEYQEGSFGIQCPKSESLGKGFKPFYWIVNEYGFELSELEVIGNIHENPELLEPRVA